MKRRTLLILSLILMLSLCIPVPAFANRYGICRDCGGNGKCHFCDPAYNPRGLGNGRLLCEGCDGSCTQTDEHGTHDCNKCERDEPGVNYCVCMGHNSGPGVCTTCAGGGWIYANESGKMSTNSGGNMLYPVGGDTVFLGGGVVKTYSDSYGKNLNPIQLKEVLANKAKEEPKPQENPKPQQDPKPQDNPGNQNPEQPQNDRPGDDRPQESMYVVDVKDSAETLKQISDGRTDMIYLLNRRVAGEYLLSIQVIRSNLSADELSKLNSMTAADIDAIKADLESVANGFDFGKSVDGYENNGKYCQLIEFGGGMKLPFTCDVLVQLPEAAPENSLKLYSIKNGAVKEAHMNAIDVENGIQYLIFSTDELCEFALTDGTLEKPGQAENNPAPDKQEEQNRPEDVPVKDTKAEETVKQTSPVVYILIGAAAAAAVFVIVSVLKKKK